MAQSLLYIVSLSLTSVVLLATFIINGLAASANAVKYGFKGRVGNISDMFFTEITPAGFTFSIWGVIYAWQSLWIVYAWSFLFRPKLKRTIFSLSLFGYTLVNLTNITWVYVFGNEYVAAGSAMLILLNVFFYITIFLLVGYFYRVRVEVNKVDIWLTFILPINGVFLYVSWTTVASLVNLTATLQYSANVDQTTSGTITLSLLLAALLTYFIIENTIFNQPLRYVFTVYPVVLWALIGVLSEQWEENENERNGRYTLALLIITAVMLVVRILFVTILTLMPLVKRRRKYTKV